MPPHLRIIQQELLTTAHPLLSSRRGASPRAGSTACALTSRVDVRRLCPAPVPALEWHGRLDPAGKRSGAVLL